MYFCSLTVILCYLRFVLNELTPCITPNSEEAVCVSLLSCSILQQALSGRDETSKKFVYASKCGDNFEVCCGSVGNYTTTDYSEKTPKEKYIQAGMTTESRGKYVLKEFLPSLKYCGYQHFDDHYNEGNHTGIDEFPWLVHLEYRSVSLEPTKGAELKCAGVLLNSFLVLTSMQCAANPIANIKIGQYHKHNSSSCISSSLFGDECTDPTIEAPVGIKIPVPETDLILIYLSERIQYSDYVRPICLPFENSQKLEVGSMVYTSGWGEEDITGSTLHVKKRILHKIKGYNESYGTDDVHFGQADSTKYVCEGDQGGPLMYSAKRKQWFLAGIVTETPCNDTQPAKANALTARTFENLLDLLFDFLPPQNS